MPRRVRQSIPGEALPQTRIIRVRDYSYVPRARRRITDDLGYVLVWTALGTVLLTVVVLITT